MQNTMHPANTGMMNGSGVWPTEVASVIDTTANKFSADFGPQHFLRRLSDLKPEGLKSDVGTPRRASERRPAAARMPGRRLHFVTLPMFFADLVTTSAATTIAYFAARLFVHAFPLEQLPMVALVLFIPIAIGNMLTGLYPGAGLNPVVEFRQLSRVAGISFLGAASLGFLSQLLGTWCLFFAFAGLIQLALAPLMRAIVRGAVRNQIWWGYPVIVFGTGPAASKVVMNLLQHPEYGLRPVAALDPNAEMTSLLGIPVLGKPRLASVIVKRTKIRYAVVALPDLTRAQATRVLERYAQGIRHVMITSAISPFAPGLPILWRDTRDLAGVAGVEVRNRLLFTAARVVKRTMDLSLTLAGGICILPILAVLAVAVKLSSPGPVFFSHSRIGERGKRFRAWKFRSMVTNGDEVLKDYLASDSAAREEWEQDHKLKNDPRVTGIGAFLRKTSLDELPQLWNVVRGEMSLVGPRPIVQDEIAKYGKCYSIYKSVRPGITGLWQVSGRNDTTYGERLEYDKYYVRNWSPWLDMHILARTVATLLFRRGAY